MSGTIKERIAAYFYRISLLKMQIHSSILSESGTQTPQTTGDDHQVYRDELEAWLKDWEGELMLTTEKNHGSGEQSLAALEAWANLNYHHTALLVTHLSPTERDNPLLSCDQIVKSCSFLTRHQQKSHLFRLALATVEGQDALVFPTSWITAHLLFSIGLSLTTWNNKYATETGVYERMGIAGRCLTALGLLESDPATLSTGFTEVLETLGHNGKTNQSASFHILGSN